MKKFKHVKSKLRVLHFPQIPCKPFEVAVKDEIEAYKVMNVLADQHLFLFKNKFIPDYANVILVEMWNANDKEWENYFNEDAGDYGMEWDELVENYLHLNA